MKRIYLKKETIMSAKLFVFAAGLVFNLCAQAQTPLDDLAAQSSKKIVSGQYLESYKLIEDYLQQQKNFNLNNCAETLNKINDTFYKIPTDMLIPDTDDKMQFFKNNGVSIMYKTRDFRESVKDKFFNMSGSIQEKSKCANAVKKTLLYSRYTEELVAEYLLSRQIISHQNSEVLSKHESTLETPLSKFDGQSFKFESGDVVLVRGVGINSAMTARIADEEQYFSHIAIVGEDQKGQLVLIEALKSGLTATPLDKYIREELARVSVFRFLNSETSKKAGQIAFETYDKKIKQSGTTFPYDFAFNENDKSEFFCSEVIQYAYSLATNGNLKIPDFRTTAHKLADSGFLKKVGTEFSEFFAPSDIELNKEFKLVVDWRNLKITPRERLADATFISLLSWVTEKKYDTSSGFFFSSITSLLQKVRELGLFKSQIPPNISYDALRTYVNLFLVDKTLSAQIGTIQAVVQKLTGFSLVCKDSMAIAEKLRQIDCKTQENLGVSNYHMFFKSKSFKCDDLLNDQNDKNFNILMTRLPETVKKAIMTQINYISQAIK